MTSKEALDKLPELMLAKNIDLLKEISECFNIIYEDLEVLEILKKIVSIKDYNPAAYPSFTILSGGNVELEDAIKIKEWIER